MLPDPEYAIPLGAELSAGPIVASSVPVDFFPPDVCSVRRGVSLACWVGVPEASVDEEREFRCCKVEVGPAEDVLWVSAPASDLCGAQHTGSRGVISIYRKTNLLAVLVSFRSRAAALHHWLKGDFTTVIIGYETKSGCNKWRATRPARGGDCWISGDTYYMIATRSFARCPGDVNRWWHKTDSTPGAQPQFEFSCRTLGTISKRRMLIKADLVRRSVITTGRKRVHRSLSRRAKPPRNVDRAF